MTAVQQKLPQITNPLSYNKKKTTLLERHVFGVYYNIY